MKKGKVKKTEKKYLSIVLVPHSSSHVKVLKFTSFYVKLMAYFVILTAVFIYSGLYISKILDENKALKQDINELHSNNTEQRKVIEEKAEEIKQLREDGAAFSEIVNDKIEEFTERFNNITDQYLAERSTMANRSGDRTETAFTKDMLTLKETIDSLGNLYSRTNLPEADITTAKTKIDEFMDTVPTLWPVYGRITDRFGYRKDPFTRKRKFHEGLDIGADYGASIKAVADGKIIFAENKAGTGRTIKISHARGISSIYGHTSKILVKVGQTVKKGDIIAKVGNSGRSTGPHLHLELRLYGTAVDPMQYLDSR